MNRIRTTMMAATALLAAACGSSGSSNLSVMLKDAPGPFTKVYVTIAEVDLIGENGKVPLTNGPQSVDLLELANKTVSLVTEYAVPKGTYTELRFVISGAYVKLDDANGSIYATPNYLGDLPAGTPIAGTLKTPSFDQSGLKIDMDAQALVITGDTKILLVDFDASQSFGQEAGASGSWVMHPVIKGIEFVMSGNIVVSASLGQGVTLPTVPLMTLANFDAVVTPTGTTSSTTIPLALNTQDGKYEAAFNYLFPGEYDVSLAASGITFTTVETMPVTVTLDQQAQETVDFTINSAAWTQ